MSNVPTSKLRKLSWDEVISAVKVIADELREQRHQNWVGIVGISRGGMIPAVLLAHEMGIRHVDTIGIATYDDQHTWPGEPNIYSLPHKAIQDQGRNWIVIDDICATGTTIQSIGHLIPGAVYCSLVYNPQEARHAGIIHALESDPTIWISFPWEIGSTASQNSELVNND